MKGSVTALFLLATSISFSVQAEPVVPTTVPSVPIVNDGENGVGNIDQFGFGPAFFVVSYDKEVLKDSKDVRVRGDGTIASSGSSYSTTLGVEVHYSFAFRLKCRLNGIEMDRGKCKNKPMAVTSGHSISPFLGLYDLDNGINGIAAGLVYGYWHGDFKNNDRTSLNVGVGWTVHKDRLTLADGVKKGSAPPAGLNAEDYTERQDVEGATIMVSASVGF